MDPVTRKEGVHVEFEQEWEGSFNLQIKLSPIIPMLVEWAASDRVVFVKALRYLYQLDKLNKKAFKIVMLCLQIFIFKVPAT